MTIDIVLESKDSLPLMPVGERKFKALSRQLLAVTWLYPPPREKQGT
jgi:hypothetical protein